MKIGRERSRRKPRAETACKIVNILHSGHDWGKTNNDCRLLLRLPNGERVVRDCNNQHVKRQEQQRHDADREVQAANGGPLEAKDICQEPEVWGRI